MFDDKKLKEAEVEYTNLETQKESIEHEKESLRKGLHDAVSHEFEHGDTLIETRWSRRSTYYSNRFVATRSSNNDKMKALMQRLIALDITTIHFGEENKFHIEGAHYGGDITIHGQEDDLMEFCFERNIVITDNERNKRIKELQTTIERGTNELADLRKKRNEDAKKMREIAKNKKTEAGLSDEWFNDKK